MTVRELRQLLFSVENQESIVQIYFPTNSEMLDIKDVCSVSNTVEGKEVTLTYVVAKDE